MTSFDANSEYMAKLASTPLLKLSFENAAFRRRIFNKTKSTDISNLLDLFALTDHQLEGLLEFEDACCILDLKERFEANPEDTAASLMAVDSHSSASNSTCFRLHSDNEASGDKAQVNLNARSHQSDMLKIAADGHHVVFPNFKGNTDLRCLEQRAARELDYLSSSFDNVMVYQAFDAFNSDFDTITVSFGSLFQTYCRSPRRALDAIDCYFGTIFLIYVAYSASKYFDGENLWGNFFDAIGISEGNSQSYFKHLFLRKLENRGLPVYGEEEETQRYLCTALLHGGLSEWSWTDLWENSIMPLVRDRGGYSLSGLLPSGLSGREILAKINQPNGRYSAKERTRKTIEKADAGYIGAVLEDAFRVANQVRSSCKSAKKSMFLSAYDLPDAAMRALRLYLTGQAGRQQADKGRKANNQSVGSSLKKERELAYLPMAQIQLDLMGGKLLLVWNKQRFPLSFANRRVDYYVNGKCLETLHFEYRPNYVLLDRVEIPLEPQDIFEVEIRLMERLGDGDDWEEMSSTSQVFSQQKPGCFEFVIGADGQCRLRGDRERISKRKNIAYLVRDGLYIKPVLGMTEIDPPNSFTSIGGFHIQAFQVEPSASGELIEESSYKTIESWQERYLVKINKKGVIGRTKEGLDAYGYNPLDYDGDCSLPSITVTALDGDLALRDLDVFCNCDGVKVSIGRFSQWSDCYSEEASIVVSFAKTVLPFLHIRNCELSIFQKSVSYNSTIAKYQFAVLPIRGFKLSRVYRENMTFLADYEFQAAENLEVVNDDLSSAAEVLGDALYITKALLEDEHVRLTFISPQDNKTTEVELQGAALRIEVPQKIDSIATQHPINLSDVLSAGYGGCSFSIEALSARRGSRAMLVLLGQRPVFFKELNSKGPSSFNLHSHADFFRMNGIDKAGDDRLTFTLYFGEDYASSNELSYGDMDLFRLQRGFGFSSWRVVLKQDGTHVLRFNGKALFPLVFEFIRVGKASLSYSSFCEKGANEVLIPALVIRLYERRRLIRVKVMPFLKRSRLGSASPLEDFAVIADM